MTDPNISHAFSIQRNLFRSCGNLLRLGRFDMGNICPGKTFCPRWVAR
jgi:hypothetical protein